MGGKQLGFSDYEWTPEKYSRPIGAAFGPSPASSCKSLGRVLIPADGGFHLIQEDLSPRLLLGVDLLEIAEPQLKLLYDLDFELPSSSPPVLLRRSSGLTNCFSGVHNSYIVNPKVLSPSL